MIAQWENKCISLSVLTMARVQLPAVAEYFKGWMTREIFFGWSESACLQTYLGQITVQKAQQKCP